MCEALRISVEESSCFVHVTWLHLETFLSKNLLFSLFDPVYPFCMYDELVPRKKIFFFVCLFAFNVNTDGLFLSNMW